MPYLADLSEREDLQRIALLACLIVAEAEGELIANPVDKEPDYESAATVWLLAQCVTLPEAVAYLRSERSVS